MTGVKGQFVHSGLSQAKLVHALCQTEGANVSRFVLLSKVLQKI